MAKRKAAARKTSRKSSGKRPPARRSAKRQSSKRPVKRQASARKKVPAKKTAKKAVKKALPPTPAKNAASRPKPKAAARRPTGPAGKVPRLDRARRILDEAETHSTPPSSLDMTQQRGSAARSGRAGMEHNQRDHRGMNEVTGGDPDVDVEDAYFAGEEAPGGDNPTPDQDIVDDIGKALGVTYDDTEELKGADKVVERDKHRWELDPASSDDYKDRD